MRTTIIVLLTIALRTLPGLAQPPPGGDILMLVSDRPPTTQPDWEIAGLWFDLAGRPWTVTIEEAGGVRSAHAVPGSTAPTKTPAGLPLVADRSLPSAGMSDWVSFRAVPGGVLLGGASSSGTRVDATHHDLLRVTVHQTHISPGYPNRGYDPGPSVTSWQETFELVRDGRALGSVPAKRSRTAAQLKQALTHADWRVRRDAIRELSFGTEAEDVGLLIASTGDRLDLNRILAIQALGRLKAKEAIKPLARLLGRAPSLVQSAAVDALAGMGPGIGPGLLAALAISNGNAVAAAGLVFSQWDRQAVAAMLAADLKADDAKVRLPALAVLFELSGPESARLAGEFMLGHVGQSDYAREVDSAGEYLLRRVAPQDLPVETLCRCAESYYAARCLSRAGPRAVPIILEAMARELAADKDLRPSRRNDTKDPAVRRMVGLVGAIHGIQPTPEQPRPADMAELYAGIKDAGLRAWLAIGFGQQADEAVIRALIADSAAAGPELRAAAAQGMKDSPQPQVIPRLLEMLKDEDEQVRTAAGEALHYRTDGVRDLLARIAPLAGHEGEFAAGAVFLAKEQPHWGLGYAIELAITHPSKGRSRVVLAALEEFLRGHRAPLPEQGLTGDNLKTWWEQTGKAWWPKPR